ncbi:MAG: BACON domain-containing protein, partial [Vicinamibacterales bacterium]
MFPKRDVSVRRGALCAALAVLVILIPTLAGAQAVIDAGRVEFTPSADHDAVSGGVPLVTSYQMQIFPAGSTQMVQSVDLGKPSPQTDGFIRLGFVSRLSAPLATGQQYEARVAAVGPGGVGASALSNQFSFSPACAPTLSASSASLPAAASNGTVTVTAAAGCAWTSTSPASWLTINSGSTGSGTAPVTFGTAANTSTTARSTTLTIAGLTFTVTQAGAACSYSIAPTARASGAAGETTTVAVTTSSTCGWTATSNAGWLTVSNGANRTGNGSVSIDVAANT